MHQFVILILLQCIIVHTKEFNNDKELNPWMLSCETLTVGEKSEQLFPVNKMIYLYKNNCCLVSSLLYLLMGHRIKCDNSRSKSCKGVPLYVIT